jgi:NAD(P)-dependent dehydrogenase (short-subunit alcohol dehydrogenase family)
MDFGIKGKVAIVTGGATGIGHAIARTFHEEGATVVINGRTQSKLDAACKGIGQNAHGVVADLRTEEGAATLADFTKQFGSAEFLVNNIGVFDVCDFFDVSDETWHDYFQHNVMTAVHISRIVLKEMLACDSGSVCFISSEAAIRSIGNMVPYSVTKTALLGLSRSLAELTRGTNVRVTSYMPGTTATESVQGYFEGLAKEQDRSVADCLEDFYNTVQPSNLTQRLIDPSMHGRGVVQLMSNTAMNGVCHRADGGTIRSIFG